ncbi:hypothetical protein K439DRAFT_1628035 [Ramaria rubella]|nr:hypothetical protein K439DRAFT_1628035 [Ramaria rubella]
MSPTHRADVFRFRYIRALAAMYIRMKSHAVDVYDLLEPLLKDYRKIRLRFCYLENIRINYPRIHTDVHGRIC